MKTPDEKVRLAQDHVDWLLETLRPLMVEEFLHGYKHGEKDVEDGKNGDQISPKNTEILQRSGV